MAPTSEDTLREFDEIIAAARDTTLLDQADFYLARARVSIRRLGEVLDDIRAR